MVFYAVDGRQSGYSAGLTQKDLADELLQQGCQWAVNLDGGGSTTLSVLLPGSSAPGGGQLPLRRLSPGLRHLHPAGHRRPHGPGAGAPGPSADGLTVLTGPP